MGSKFRLRERDAIDFFYNLGQELLKKEKDFKNGSFYMNLFLGYTNWSGLYNAVERKFINTEVCAIKSEYYSQSGNYLEALMESFG